MGSNQADFYGVGMSTDDRPPARGLLVAGTSSDAGKSLVTAGICRFLARQGLRVAPFKAQNMSNNSMVCPDGTEIGRAQYLQAQAAGAVPESAMNPVLLKPGSDRRSFVVVRGRPAGTLEAGEFAAGRRHLARGRVRGLSRAARPGTTWSSARAPDRPPRSTCGPATT